MLVTPTREAQARRLVAGDLYLGIAVGPLIRWETQNQHAFIPWYRIGCDLEYNINHSFSAAAGIGLLLHEIPGITGDLAVRYHPYSFYSAWLPEVETGLTLGSGLSGQSQQKPFLGLKMGLGGGYFIRKQHRLSGLLAYAPAITLKGHTHMLHLFQLLLIYKIPQA